MKTFIFMSLTVFAFSSFAGTFSSLQVGRLVNPQERAEWDITKTDVKTINWGKEIAILTRGKNASCGKPLVTVGREVAIGSLDSYYNESHLARALNQLHKQGKILKAISAFDGDEGESEYCSISTFVFYGHDGEVLTIYYDYNT